MAIVYQHAPGDSDSEDDEDDDDDNDNQQAPAGSSGNTAVTSWILEQSLGWHLRTVPMLTRDSKDIGVFRLTANTLASVSLRPASQVRPKSSKVKSKATVEGEGEPEPLVIEAQLTLTGKLSNRTSAQGFGVCILTSYASSRQVQSGRIPNGPCCRFSPLCDMIVAANDWSSHARD